MENYFHVCMYIFCNRVKAIENVPEDFQSSCLGTVFVSLLS